MRRADLEVEASHIGYVWYSRTVAEVNKYERGLETFETEV